MKVSDRTFLISGGSSGLGLATAQLLLSHNANVSILDLNAPTIDSAPSSITDPSQTLFISTDVSSTTSISTAIKKTLDWIKETHKPLGGAICCAGIGYGDKALPRQSPDATHESVKMMDMKMFDRVISINLRGTVDLIRQTLPHLSLNEPEGSDGERGVIIVVSSVAAFEGQVGQLAYSASKGAVRSIVLPLAREVGRQAGIRVMGIAPGVFETGMTTRPKKIPAKSEAADGKSQKQKPNTGGTASKAAINPEMANYPLRMGKGAEFARLVREIVENPMLNGEVVRLDGGVRMPSRL